MIIESLMNLLLKLFGMLTAAINIPVLPDSVSTFMTDALSYIKTGLQLLAVYTNLEYLLILFGLIIAIDVGIAVYHFVMWVLRKIPMLGIS